MALALASRQGVETEQDSAFARTLSLMLDVGNNKRRQVSVPATQQVHALEGQIQKNANHV